MYEKLSKKKKIHIYQSIASIVWMNFIIVFSYIEHNIKIKIIECLVCHTSKAIRDSFYI